MHVSRLWHAAIVRMARQIRPSSGTGQTSPSTCVRSLSDIRAPTRTRFVILHIMSTRRTGRLRRNDRATDTTVLVRAGIHRGEHQL